METSKTDHVITEPPKIEHLCPYLPPMPELAPEITQGGRITGRQVTTGRLLFAPCQREKCAIYENCQGDYSPRALAGEIKTLKESLGALKGLPAVAPFLSRFLPGK